MEKQDAVASPSMIIDPIDLLFGGMEKLGPGDEEHTLRALQMLPTRTFSQIVDAGCGTGRQTLTLARTLQVVIDAVDVHQPFLDGLTERAHTAGLTDLVRTRHMDMTLIPTVFQGIDLLWSEGSAYNIGFANALASWKQALSPDGCLVVSELAWLSASPPSATRAYFENAYPDMRHTSQNLSLATKAGYEILGSHVLPEDAWERGYYDILEPRAAELANHPDTAVREFALETSEEIKVFREAHGSYGYVFYILRNG